MAGTSRKWLHGPRGVGFVVVSARWRPHLAGPPSLHSHVGHGPDVRADPGVSVLETREAPVAARVAWRRRWPRWWRRVPADVATAWPGSASTLRRLLLDRVPSLPLGEPVDEPSAIVTIRPAEPGRAREVVAALASQGLRAGVVPAGRALDVPVDVVRLSPAPWVTHEHLERGAAVIAGVRP